jgi:hypothetical protein
MAWHAIPQRHWGKFLRRFAREHETWLVSAETGDGQTASPQPPSLEPLRDVRLVDTSRGPRVVVTLGGEPAHRLIIDQPTRIAIDETPDGAHGGIAIEGEQGRVRLRFRIAVPADMVDGLID